MKHTLLLNIILAVHMTLRVEAFTNCVCSRFSTIISRPKIVFHRQLDEDEEDIKYILLGDETLDEATLAEVEGGKPSQWMIIQQMFGINVFTYILAAAIAFFFSMNVLLGPGWLGNQIGIQSTGTFDDVSKSLPQTIDLSDPEYRI